ncbi:hypothetical protein CLAIMM_03728 [Cladophialophora immunda]|nr:hypothetical protein CLAIMM_03728 [Cladophialophora immunda]
MAQPHKAGGTSIDTVYLKEDSGPSQAFLHGPDGNIRHLSSGAQRNATYSRFLWLAIPTVLAVGIFVADCRDITFGGRFYTVVVENRASISIAVGLFNFATRLRLTKTPTSLGVLQFWNAISSGILTWSLRPELLALLCIYLGVAAVPSAIWAGSLTPVATSTSHATTVRIPQYSNLSLVREWPSEIGSSGPFLRNTKGFFTYSIGIEYVGQLTQSLTTGTTTDGSARHHIKYDNSNFLYIGRSFGVDSSVGLVDDDILRNPLAQSYHFQELGYATEVSCDRNTSAGFFQISPDAVEDMLYAAEGYLPDSTEPEYSVYVGHGPSAIVAFGVAANQAKMTSRRYLGIAAGSSYVNLNAIQCVLDFIPATFDIAVDANGKSINTARRTAHSGDDAQFAPASDMEPSGDLTHVVARQFELYTNDLTNIYQSVVGNALNLSITDYQTFLLRAQSDNISARSSDSASLRGVENSITAMLDDILVGYASAQLMIAKDSIEIPATVSLSAIRFGKSVYVYVNIAINVLVLLLVAEEAARSRGWKNLATFDYTNLTHLVIAASRGGRGILDAVGEVSPTAEPNGYAARAEFGGSWRMTRLARLLRWISGRDKAESRVRILLREDELPEAVEQGREREGLGRFRLAVA